jgi:hypothetical protein
MKFRKRPVVIEARQWDGTAEEASHIIDWILDSGSRPARYHGPKQFGDCGSINYDPPKIVIDTLEGVITASPDDFIIQGVQGEFYPCKPDIFEATYEPVGQEQGDE